MTVSEIGLVGCGRMGGQVGRHLLASGWSLGVSDPDADARAPLVAAGAREATDAAELGTTSDLLLLAVVDDEQVRDVLVGSGAVLDAVRPGTIIAVCASVRPDTCRELAEQARARGAELIDVAMVGGERGAEAGTLTLLCGGDESALRACQPAFSAFAISVCALGDVGAGQVGKAVNNILLWSAIRADVEALRLGRALGVDPARLRPAVAIGSGGNRPLLDWAQARLRWPAKDLQSALAMADDAGIDVPFVRTLADLMQETSVDDLVDLR